MSIAVVVGNPKAGSRTLRVAMAVADALRGTFGGCHRPLRRRLAVVGAPAFRFRVPRRRGGPRCRRTQRPAGGGLTDLQGDLHRAVKSFFDRYGNDALAGTVSIPVMTGAALVHAAGTRGPPPPTPGRAGQLHPDAGALRHRAAVRRPRRRGRLVGPGRPTARRESPRRALTQRGADDRPHLPELEQEPVVTRRRLDDARVDGPGEVPDQLLLLGRAGTGDRTRCPPRHGLRPHRPQSAGAMPPRPRPTS